MLQVLRERRELQEQPDLLVHKERQVQRVLQEQLGLRVRKVLLEQTERTAPMEQMALTVKQY